MLVGWAAIPALGQASAGPAAGGNGLNVLLITADDMNYDSLGVTGCKLPGISPNLDRLASEGMRFTNAHVTVAVCQPSRSVMMTGRYPSRNGAMGFEAIRRDVPTLGEQLRAAGYLNGIFAKVGHLAPGEKFCWDVVVSGEVLDEGRNPAKYYEQAKSFFEKARAADKPFFLMANSQDPHRPFAGAGAGQGDDDEGRAAGRKRKPAFAAAPVGKAYRPDEVLVPGFLPDLPEVRTELAQFYTSVRRCDETVGQILRALREMGLEDRTIVMFLSDNGMPFPFAKTNCYRFSTRTPWMVRWPKHVEAGKVDTEHFISGIDMTPTILDALGLPPIAGVDGRSFLPLLRGEKQDGRDRVYTVFHQTSGRQDFPMRAVQDRRFGYIYNAWADGAREFRNEARGSTSYKAMEKAAGRDPAVAARVKMFLYRAKEEFYDYDADPNALHNLIADPQHRDGIAEFRREVLRRMESIQDPLLAEYKTLLAGQP